MWPFSSIPVGAECRVVETLPAEVSSLQVGNMSTFECFSAIVESATKFLYIASFCCNLGSTREGVDVKDKLCTLAKSGVNVTVLVDVQSKDRDAEELREAGVNYYKVKVSGRDDVGNLLGSFWISNAGQWYVGSASLTGGSISNIKNLGVYSTNRHLATDLMNRYNTFYSMIVEPKVPFSRLCCAMITPTATDFHLDHAGGGVFFSDAPEKFLGFYRTLDEDLVLHRIDSAKNSIDLSLLSLVPVIRHADRVEYWPRIMDALLRAAIDRSVRVRVIVTEWKNADPLSVSAARTLNDFGVGSIDISTRLFSIPGRDDAANNTKLLIVDDTFAHVTVANMDGTHYKYHAFVSVNAEKGDIVNQLSAVFERDWRSQYCKPIN
ncbi:EEV envelope phospholipase [Bovine papular stomatitis virus]|uniref:EEV phospholipase n=31 Tax=Bovine papular stomatitis virus TaxID=129727 RepID=Q6TVH7_9POXV|nr:palmytilated EEV membrane glycoprotein [Bovine papular stomatitis virus]AAR98368.1 ORF011 EEV phospholipase [Bovine papular stomatitis virus]AKC03180.1 EEV phospholipase [Bovine papular stomatitis virus]AKC03309.1 EEV phospholipase [Bovine papular stomatitis virus]AKC03437.1 EEV phospholipase [Bovine papular stomatitis virus]